MRSLEAANLTYQVGMTQGQWPSAETGAAVIPTQQLHQSFLMCLRVSKEYSYKDKWPTCMQQVWPCVHAQEDAPAVQQYNTPVSLEHPEAHAAPQLLSRSEELPQARQEDGQHTQQLPQADKLGEGDSKKGHAEESDAGLPAASQQDEDLVRVAHLGEGALLNDWPLLVRVMHILRNPRSDRTHSNRSTHGQQHTGQPAQRSQASAQQEEGMRAGPSREPVRNNAANAMAVKLLGAHHMCHIALLADGSVGLVPSAAFMQNWDWHTTVHPRRLQAPRDGSSDDSAESSDDSTSGSSSSCDEADGCQDAAAHMEAAEKGHCSSGISFKMGPREDGAAIRGTESSPRGDRPSETCKKKRPRKGMSSSISLQLVNQ